MQANHAIQSVGTKPMFKDTAYWVMVLIPAIFIAGLYLTPVISVMIRSVTEPTLGFGNYAEIMDNRAIQSVLSKTLYICGVTTSLTLLLGYITAYAMVHAPEREQRLIFFLVILSFWISVVIRTFAWIAVLQPRGLINTALIELGLIDSPLRMVRNDLGVIIGMVHYMLPYAILPLVANMQTIDKSFVPAARALGASSKRAFFTIFLPLSAPGLAGAAILVTIFASGFYITPALLGGGKVVMIAEYISVQMQETLKWGLATSMATCLMIVVLTLAVIMSRFMDAGSAGKGK
jgi:putative spermidine/putrescine transport system permease protein